jgi:hypothetical protein
MLTSGKFFQAELNSHNLWHIAGTGAPTIKNTAAAGSSEDPVWRNASVPRRRTTLDRSNVTPELNAYIKGKAPRGEVRNGDLVTIPAGR